MSHTPGPWKWLCELGDSGCLNSASGKVIDYANYEGMWFATYDAKTDAANARLIASAPAMYDAIEEALEFIDGYVDVVDGDYGQPAPNRAMRLQSTLLAALGRRPAP